MFDSLQVTQGQDEALGVALALPHQEDTVSHGEVTLLVLGPLCHLCVTPRVPGTPPTSPVSPGDTVSPWEPHKPPAPTSLVGPTPHVPWESLPHLPGVLHHPMSHRAL